MEGLSFEVEPYEEFPVPGTPFVVYHQGDEESTARLGEDGSLHLYGGPDWTVRLAPPPAVTTTLTQQITALVSDPNVVVWAYDLKGA